MPDNVMFDLLTSGQVPGSNKFGSVLSLIMMSITHDHRKTSVI